MGGKKKQTTGFRYFMGLHFGITHGEIDALEEVRVGGRTAWSGEQTASGSITINAENLFGGKKREGGVQGVLDVMGGEESQGQNSYLVSKLGTLLPAFRGIFSAVFRGGSGLGIDGGGGYITANNPYIKPWAFKLRRIYAGWGVYAQGEVTELAADVLYEWNSGNPDSRNVGNAHQYGAGLRDTLSEALDDFEAFYNFRPIEGTVYAYDAGDSQIYPYSGTLSTDPVELHLHLNALAADSINTTPYVGVALNCPMMYEATGGQWPSDRIWTSGWDLFGAYPFAGVHQMHSLTAGVYTPPLPAGNFVVGQFGACTEFDGGGAPEPLAAGSVVQDSRISVRRVPSSPALPGSGLPDWTVDPDNYWYDSSTGQIYSKEPYAKVTGSYRWLALYADSAGLVTQYPLGPARAQGSAEDTEASWVADYNAAVAAGDAPAGWTYNAAGTGGVGTYPRNAGYAWTRTYTAYVQGPPFGHGIARIGDHMNPAHIIYQCQTDVRWGKGFPQAAMDEASFLAAAQTLYDEEFGISLLWNRQGSVDEFIKIIVDHIGAVTRVDPATGLRELKLIRGDYDPDELDLFDENNIEALEDFQRATYGNLVNEITVVYTDQTTFKDVPVTVHDLACIQAQGRVISDTRRYPGIRSFDIASRVAMRDLIAASTPLAKGKIKCTRALWNKKPGDVVKLSWTKLGLSGVVVRIMQINYGTLESGSIVADFVEDVFGLPASAYVQQQENLYTDPVITPEDVDPADILEAPYFDIATTLSAADLDYTDADEARVLTLGAQGAPTEISYSVLSRVGGGDYEEVSDGPFTATALTVDALTQEDTVIAYTEGESMDDIVVGDRGMLGTGRLAEHVMVTAIDTEAQEITVSRGILDTTPQVHAAGTRFWLIEDGFGVDPTERATGETINVKLIANSGGGESSEATATVLSLTADQRFFRPYAPGNVGINGNPFPATISEPFTITWAHRDRVQQTAYYVEQDEGDIGPEPGTTYNVTVYNDDDDSILASVIGETGTSYSPSISGAYNLRVEIYASRDGVQSWQAQVREFTYADGIIVSDDDDAIVSDEQDFLVEEGTVITGGGTFLYTTTFAFSGTFSASDIFYITATVGIQTEHLTVSGAGKTTLTELATDLAGQLNAEFPAADAVAVGSTVTFGANQLTNVQHGTNTAQVVSVETQQAPLPITAGVLQVSFVDVYQLSGTAYVLSPQYDSAFNSGGTASIGLQVTGRTYAARKAIGIQEGGFGHDIITINWTVSTPTTFYLPQIVGLEGQIDGNGTLSGYSITASSGATGSMSRSAIPIQATDDYIVVEPVSQTSSHPSGFKPLVEIMSAGAPDLPSGAKQLSTALFFSSNPIAEDQIYEITLDGVPYSYTATALDTDYSDIATGLAGVIPSGDYTVTYYADMNFIEVERDVVDTAFTMSAYASYGGKLTVTSA